MEFVTVASLAELPAGSVRCVELEGSPISLANVDGEVHAFAAYCTHQRALLEDGDLEGTTIHCPWHAGSFDVTTGRALTAPAVEDMQTYPVRLDGDRVQVAKNAVLSAS